MASPAPPSPTLKASDSPTERVLAFFAALTPQSLATDLPTIFAPQARFKDPFNDVTGHAAIRHVFDDMFERCAHPRFVIVDRIDGGAQAFATWRFEFGGPSPDTPRWQIHGSTHWQFADDGRVLLHRDYWDTGEELYAKLPVMGGLVRLIRRRLAA